MTINTMINGGPRFRIRRPVTAGGFVTEVDETIKAHLAELNQLLGKRVFPKSFAKWGEKDRESAEDFSVADIDAIAPGGFFEESASPGELFDEYSKAYRDIGEPLPVPKKKGGKSKAAMESTAAEKDAGETPEGIDKFAREMSTGGIDLDEDGDELDEASRMGGLITRLLSRPLTGKRIVWKADQPKWDKASLLFSLDRAPEDKSSLSLSEFIETVPKLSKLKFQFQRNLAEMYAGLDYNAQAVLGKDYPAVVDYLVAHAYYVGRRREIDGLTNSILSGSKGVSNIAKYGIVSAARTYINDKQLNVNKFNDDDSSFIEKLISANLLLSAASFKTALRKTIDDFVFNTDEAELIRQFERDGYGEIPDEIEPLLIKYIQNSPIPITDKNYPLFLPLFISQARAFTATADTTEIDRVESTNDFEVNFLEDDISMVQISQSAVKCAAQLYYAMVVGDELDVFGVVNYFTHKYLLRGAIEIQDRRLREDLQNYVFSNRFTNVKTNELVDRTRPAERHMFYRQVFNEGKAPVTEDVVVNKEIPRLWKVLMLESAEYLERAQSSFYPDRYVSPQNVMQAVEDIQYNLSTHCTGMANVITPLIYAELDFVIRRILQHPDVLRQIVPQGGTWWRVVETLYMEMKRMRPKATVLYNKAKLGNEIIRMIADYNPATFDDDKTFSAFISTVDAFITTQSILQEALTDFLKKDEVEDEEPELGRNGYHQPAPEMAGVPAAPGAGSESDEWEF